MCAVACVCVCVCMCLARHSERGKKTRRTKEEVGRQHQEMDRPGVRQVPEGSGEQGKMEKTGCKIICCTPTTLAVKGLMMMIMTLLRCPYTSVCNRIRFSPCQSSVDYGNTKTPSMYRRLGSATPSQQAFPREGNPNFPWEKPHWDNTVVESI